MASMLSLLDVLPRHERVGIGGDDFVDVFGICGEDIGKILERFPDAFQQMAVAAPTKMNPGLLGALLAASQRNGEEESLLGNEKAEQRGRTLPIGAQVKMLQALGRCTFPDGIGPFLESYMSISSAATEAIEILVQVGSREQDMASRRTRKPSEQPDTPASGS